MIKQQRQKRILSLLESEGTVEIAALARLMPEVSQVTLRRDVTELAEAGALRRTHGGAVLPDAVILKHPALRQVEPVAGVDIDSLDAAILPPLPGRGGNILRRHIVQRGIPFLAESAPQEGGCYLGPDNHAAGHELGRIAGGDAPGGALRVLIVGHPELPNTCERAAGFLAGLSEAARGDLDVVQVNGQGNYRAALRVSLDAIASGAAFHIAFGVNDHSAIAVAEAARRNDQPIAVYATGGENPDFVARVANRNRIRAIAAFFPEIVGERAIDILAAALNGAAMPEAAITPHAIVTAETLGDYYERTGDGWRLKQARRLPPPMVAPQRAVAPKVGFMPHFPAHDWYRGMMQSMQARAALHGLNLIEVPPHKGISAEVSRLRVEIARAAGADLCSGETIIIGEGEATLCLAEEIRRIAFHDASTLANLTVITNAFDVLYRLEGAPGIKTILTSGEYQAADRCLVGPSLGALFERVRADRAYISAGGLSRRFGLSSPDERLALAGSRLTEAARRVIVLADHTVIGLDATHRIARIDDIHEVITDDGAVPKDRQSLRAAGVSVRVAGDDSEIPDT